MKKYIVLYGGAHGKQGQMVRLKDEDAAKPLKSGFIIAAPEPEPAPVVKKTRVRKPTAAKK